jgi:hypothetical protein
MYTRLHVKYLLFFSDFNELEYYRKILKKYIQLSNFMQIRPVGA